MYHATGLRCSASSISWLDTPQKGMLGSPTRPPPRLTPLTDGGVVAMATEQQHALKVLLLLWRRLEFILEGLAFCLLFHTLRFCLTDNKGQRSVPSWPFRPRGFHPPT
jgi:hypothetical protein